jgi:hypothetical protein
MPQRRVRWPGIKSIERVQRGWAGAIRAGALRRVSHRVGEIVAADVRVRRSVA